jgi:hypothetical protein
MSILVRLPSSVTAEQYESVRKKLESTNQWPADGVEVHVCFGSGDTLRVSEIWESREKMEAFGAVLMPMLEENGIDVQSTPPEILEVHRFEAFRTSSDSS